VTNHVVEASACGADNANSAATLAASGVGRAADAIDGFGIRMAILLPSQIYLSRLVLQNA
jgi:hypothetical protein